MRVDLVSEAERIVSGGEKKKDVEFDILLNVVMTLSCIMLAIVMALGLLY